MSYVETYLGEAAAILGRLDVAAIGKMVDLLVALRARCSSWASAAAPATRPTR